MNPQEYAKAVALIERLGDLDVIDWRAALARSDERDAAVRDLAARLIEASEHDTGVMVRPVGGRCLEAIARELDDGAPDPRDPYRLIGKVLADTYEVESLVACGGMGAVYKARHTRLATRLVAVKVVPAMLRERLVIEGSAGCEISHHAVVAVTDFNTLETGDLYLVMEYVDGPSLREVLSRSGRLPLTDAIEIVRQVASALDAAHDASFIHRDIKPDNILLERRGAHRPRVRVIDFGIAKRTDEDGGEPLTGDGTFIGTVAYMSPEQLGYRPRDDGPPIDHRTDVYSLALVFFEAVAGRRPVDGNGIWELRDRIVRGAHCNLSDVAPDVPTHVSMAVARALSVERSARPMRASAFAKSIEVWQDRDVRTSAASAPPASAAPPPRLPDAPSPRQDSKTWSRPPAAPPASAFDATLHHLPPTLPIAPPPHMAPLERIEVETRTGISTIEFMHGDLTAMPRDWDVDVLVVSAYPATYAPVSGSLIEALEMRGLDVDRLVRDRDERFGALPSCWVSKPLRAYGSTLPVDRILCFEIPWRSDQGESFVDLFASLGIVTRDLGRPATVAMPIIAAGSQRAQVDHVAKLLVAAALKSLREGLNVRRMIVADRDAAKAAALGRAVRGG